MLTLFSSDGVFKLIVLFSGRKSSGRTYSIFIFPLGSPKPDSEARMAWRQAVRNKRNAVVVTIFRCFLVRRWQNSRIQQSIRLRCFFSFLIVPCF